MIRRIAAFLLVMVMAACTPGDPAGDVVLQSAPPGTQDFFKPGIEGGVLYAYIPADGGIFVYRRDLDRFGWITEPQFRKFVAHAKRQGGYLVYTVEDGDLKQSACESAFRVILDADINTQDPLDLLPLLQQELMKRTATSR